jgi:23S rRNA (pseudouridine1915-N3)-methyltransferase
VNDVLLIWVGRRATGAVAELAEEYRRRIARHVALNEVRIRPEPGREGDPARARARERDRILEHLVPHDTMVALDERGRERTTAELAEWLVRRSSPGRVVFVIGSDLGLAPDLVATAHDALALSRLTLPHDLARVVLLEQLYRCLDYLDGGAYHRGADPSFGYNHPRRRRR